MRPPSYNMTIPDGISPRVFIALMLATLALEAVDAWRGWSSGVEVLITPDECYRFCGGWVASWGPQACTCIPPKVDP